METQMQRKSGMEMKRKSGMETQMQRQGKEATGRWRQRPGRCSHEPQNSRMTRTHPNLERQKGDSRGKVAPMEL
jgi:hypothetical protein